MKGKKSRINKNTYLVDRISPLPDSLLGYILSFLATKEAVTTSVLSKRWKFAWVTVHNLDFYYYNDSNRAWNEAENMKFVLFVYRVLLLRDAGWLNKFRLVWLTRSIPSHVSTWIDTAITKKVHELYLSFDERMPIRVFNCDSLRSLKLLGSTFVDEATVIYLPRLERLKLDTVYFKSKEACEKLVNGCPMLHYLNLNMCSRDDDYDSDDDDFTCIISSASLRHLKIYFKSTSCLHLKASSLEYLKVNGAISKIYVEERLSSLVEADICIGLHTHDFLNNSIVEVIRAFDCAKFLTLSFNVMQALGRATISLSTEFKRLVKLEADAYFSSSQDFIQNSENLEELIIHQYTSSLPYHSKWTNPVEVPRCLSNSLKMVRFYGYNGLEDEREMIRYILEYGSALEAMWISCSMRKAREKLKLVQEICEFPRKSPVCKVKFLV